MKKQSYNYNYYGFFICGFTKLLATSCYLQFYMILSTQLNNILSSLNQMDTIMAELLGRLYKTKKYDKMNFLCSNGTIIYSVGRQFLVNLFYNFKHPEYFTGKKSETKWKNENHDRMDKYMNDCPTLAVITKDLELIIYDPIIFQHILKDDDSNYLSPSEFKEERNLSWHVSTICKKCKANKIRPSYQDTYKHWHIHKDAYIEPNKKGGRPKRLGTKKV